MTMPRQVLPETSYLLTRGTRSRRFFLTPDIGLVTLIFMFCIAVAALRTGVQVHCVCVMSNHVHLVITDVYGRLPQFTQWLFRHTSLCLKALRIIDENLWSTERDEPVKLVSPEALLEAMAYVMANPASADLVAQAHQWPGLVTEPGQVSGWEQEVEPPTLFFRHLEATAFRITMPALLTATWSPAEIVESLRCRIKEYEAEAAARRRATGRTVLGLKGIARTDPFAQPRTPRRRVEEDDKADGLVPRFKALCRTTLQQAHKQLRDFWLAYRVALDQFRESGRAVFPAGTWAMRVNLCLPVMALE